MNRIIVILAIGLVLQVTVGCYQVYSRTYCPPPPVIFLKGTDTTRTVCPRTLTPQKPLCPAL